MNTDKEYIKIFTDEEEINLFLQRHKTKEFSFIVISSVDINDNLCTELMERGAHHIYKGLTTDKINEVFEMIENRLESSILEQKEKKIKECNLKIVFIKNRLDFEDWCNQTPITSIENKFKKVSGFNGAYVFTLFKARNDEIQKVVERGYYIIDKFDSHIFNKEYAQKDYCNYIMKIDEITNYLRTDVREYVNRQLRVY